MTQVGFIGLGLMGSRMAGHLLKAGHHLTIWNRTADKAAVLLSQGAQLATTPRELASKVDVLFLSLTNADAVETILFDSGVAKALKPDSLVIDTSSIVPVRAQLHAQQLTQLGIAHLDAPVSGGTRGAEAASLAIMAGGDTTVFERARPFLACLGRPTHIGPSGTGQIAKLANQAIVAITIGAVAEALTLARKAGANPVAVRQALTGGFADSRILHEHGERMLSGDFIPGGTVRNQIKDLDAALDVVQQFELDLPLLKTTRTQFQSLANHFGDQQDHSSLYRLWENS
jgi:2-hydroxy-3-oxopropionate reductase